MESERSGIRIKQTLVNSGYAPDSDALPQYKFYIAEGRCPGKAVPDHFRKRRALPEATVETNKEVNHGVRVPARLPGFT